MTAFVVSRQKRLCWQTAIYLSEGLSISLACLLGDEGDLSGLLGTAVHLDLAGEQAHQKQQCHQAQQGKDSHSHNGKLIG